MLRELTASQLVAVATRSDTGSHNMLDLKQSLVSPHYVCNGYLSVICVVFLWIVSIDKAYLNILVVISKLLCQSILAMCQLPRMNIPVLRKDWLRHQNQ